jgi:hypothetical protein
MLTRIECAERNRETVTSIDAQPNPLRTHARIGSPSYRESLTNQGSEVPGTAGPVQPPRLPIGDRRAHPFEGSCRNTQLTNLILTHVAR